MKTSIESKLVEAQNLLYFLESNLEQLAQLNLYVKNGKGSIHDLTDKLSESLNPLVFLVRNIDDKISDAIEE